MPNDLFFTLYCSLHEKNDGAFSVCCDFKDIYN